MKNRKQVGINSLMKYTDRDFDSIKASIVANIKRYYSDTYNDFTSSGFGTMMVDTASYIGDVLSFYLDYQANESFLDTAIEYENILKHGRLYGYTTQLGYASYGLVALYATVPADSTGVSPDSDYIPVLRRGSTMSTVDDKNFILVDDVDFSVNSEVRVATVDTTTGVPLSYAIKTFGRVISGEVKTVESVVGNYEQFLKISLEDDNITEIISVFDSEGNEYFEVDFLSQNTVYRELTNTIASNPEMILKPIIVSRRYITRDDTTGTYIQFGGGSDNILTQDYVNNPQDVVMNFHGKNYITNATVDPTKLIKSDKFGISPSNTTLTVSYRLNSYENVNVGVGGLNAVVSYDTYFRDSINLNENVMNTVTRSIEVYNEEPIVGSVLTDNYEELKTRIFDMFSAQHRAVTAPDYKALVYSMPSKFGGVKRCNIVSNPSNVLKDDLNLYITSEDALGNLIDANSTIKSNIRTWLSGNKMASDTISILDAKILNIGIDFDIIVKDGFNRLNVLDECINTLTEYYSVLDEIGEPFMISDIYTKLKYIDGVLDCTSVNISQKEGGDYSSLRFDMSQALSRDGRQINIPKNVVVEIKYPDLDIRGVVR